MSDRSDFAWRVMEGEGLDYSLTSYFGPDISTELPEETEFVELWRKASGLLTEIESILYDWQNEEDEEPYEETLDDALPQG